MASHERFGYEWNKFSNITSVYETQFKYWISPLTTDDFRDQSILDAGCGMGRNSYWTLKWGAKNLTALDLDQRSVNAARRNLSQFPNAEVILKSIYKIDWQDKFDLVMCIGVLHHLKYPEQALENMVRSLRRGGRLVIWVYSYEGNEWIVKYINPMRKHITSKLPVLIVYFLSYFFSLPLWLFVRIFKGPTEYLGQLSQFQFWHIHSIVFDQLIPEVANYWAKAQVSQLFTMPELENIQIHRPPNNMGWTIVATKR